MLLISLNQHDDLPQPLQHAIDKHIGHHVQQSVTQAMREHSEVWEEKYGTPRKHKRKKKRGKRVFNIKILRYTGYLYARNQV